MGGGLGHAEVAELKHTVTADEDILRLTVAVDYILAAKLELPSTYRCRA